MDEIRRGDRNHLEVALFQTALQRGMGSQCGTLRDGDFAPHAQAGELDLERFLAVTEFVELDRQKDVTQTRGGEKSGKDDPARKRSGVDRVKIFLARTVHMILSATRSFALRERGFARCSLSLGSIGFEVI